MRANRQDGIQHQHPLPRPWLQAPVVRDAASDIVAEFLVDVFEGRRQRADVWLHRKTQTMGHAGSVVGILTQQQDPDRLVGCHLQRSEDVLPWWQDRPPIGGFPFKKCVECAKGIAGRLDFEQRLPAGRNGRQHKTGFADHQMPHALQHAILYHPRRIRNCDPVGNPGQKGRPWQSDHRHLIRTCRRRENLHLLCDRILAHGREYSKLKDLEAKALPTALPLQEIMRRLLERVDLR